MTKDNELLNTPEIPENEAALDEVATALEKAAELAVSKAEELEADLEQFADKAEKAEAKAQKMAEKAEAKAAKKAARLAKNGEKMKNKNLLKRSTYSIVFAVILIAVLVLVNVLSTEIAQRLPTTIDVTTDASNSLTADNIDFIKGIDEEVEIVMCATREGYTGSEMVNYAYNTYYVQENSTPYNYFNQTVVLVESYPKYNSKIKVSYMDPQSPEFKTLESGSDISINYGDILVRSSRMVDGKMTDFSSVITFEDIYELYDASNGGAMYGMGSYVITASSIESELSGAIYTVASSDRSGIALLTGHAEKGAADALVDSLEGYNFEFAEIEGALNADALKDIRTVILVSPVSDLSASELRVLDKFLDNDGKRGKSFLVFGSTSAPATPNLDQFMEEWGIAVEDGMAYETNSKYRYQDAVLMWGQDNDLVGDAGTSELLCFSANNVALKQAYEESDSRTNHILMTTSPYAVVAPKGTKSGYTPPSSAKEAEIPTVMVTEDTTYDDDYDEVTSYVGYFASADFVSDAWYDYGSVGNMEYAVTVVNAISGRDSSNMYFLPKITGTTSMTVSDSQQTAVRVVCMIVLPLVVLIGGILIWILRRVR